MTDTRTEARRRIALATHRLVCSGCTDAKCVEMDEADWDVADVVLELFPDVEWHGFLNVSDVSRGRRLVLHGSVEPVVPEEPKP